MLSATFAAIFTYFIVHVNEINIPWQFSVALSANIQIIYPAI